MKDGPTLNGLDITCLPDTGNDLRCAFDSSPPARDTDPAPPFERWPTLVSIGLGDALDAIERVTTWAQQGKHKGAKWSAQTQDHQIAKMLGHISRAMKGEEADEDTGEHPYAHVAARALMLLGLALRGQARTVLTGSITTHNQSGGITAGVYRGR